MSTGRPQEDYDSALWSWFSRPADAGDEAGLKPQAQSSEHLAALERVRAWVRQRFNLLENTAIMVSEIACNLPGCPPLETVVAFWEESQRYHFKLFKPVREVAADNLPFAWMKESLIVPEGFGCECC